MKLALPDSWHAELSSELDKPYFLELEKFVSREYEQEVIYPAKDNIFNAFHHCAFNETKVVLIGQDPYHGQGQANGLCFSVNDGVPLPPSLKNIFKELKDDTGNEIPFDNFRSIGNLEHWAKQGVLMLNATLTVRSKSPGSHQKKGWEEFTDAVIKKLADTKEDLVFILWGAYAQKKGAFIDKKKHHVLESAHPSPFSVHKGFFGSKPFSKTNDFLESKAKDKINW